MADGKKTTGGCARQSRANRAPQLLAEVIFCWITFSALLCFGDVTLGWSPSPGEVTGYNIYYGTASHAYSRRITVGNTNAVTLTGLKNETTYFFAISTIAGGWESELSPEMIFNTSVEAPALQLSTTPAGQRTLQGIAPVGHSYDILATTNFVFWQAIANVTADVDGSFSVVDSAASQFRARFYQARETTDAASSVGPTVQLSGGNPKQKSMRFSGQIGHAYEVLASQDLATWKRIGTVTSGQPGPATFTDTAAGLYPRRFYLLHDVTYAASTPTYQLSMDSSGNVRIQIHGLAGHTYEVVSTQDFIRWDPIGTVAIGLGGSATFLDNPTSALFRFYGLREITVP